MKAKKKRTAKAQPGNLRNRSLWADVTPQEQKEIQEYCRRKDISVSQFMADLMLKDVAQSKHRRKERVILRPEIKLTAQQLDKLEVLARLHKKKSLGEFIFDVLEPELELKRLHVPVKKKMIRFYLSQDERTAIIGHTAASGLSVTNYATLLALRTIRKDSTKSPK